MFDRAREDKRFAAKVMVAYRLSHGDRYFTHTLLQEEQESAVEIYRIIDRHEDDIAHPKLICEWPSKHEKYAEKLKDYGNQ